MKPYTFLKRLSQLEEEEEDGCWLMILDQFLIEKSNLVVIVLM